MKWQHLLKYPLDICCDNSVIKTFRIVASMTSWQMVQKTVLPNFVVHLSVVYLNVFYTYKHVADVLMEKVVG
jgi:hypothetical protein